MGTRTVFFYREGGVIKVLLIHGCKQDRTKLIAGLYSLQTYHAQTTSCWFR